MQLPKDLGETARPGDSPVLSSDTVEVVVGVLRVTRDGKTRLLISKRQRDAVLGGCWEFPGGKVEPNESFEDALVREFQEELGVSVRVDSALMRVEHLYAHGRVALNVFWCTHEAGEPRALEVEDFAWVTPSQLRAHRFPDANDTIIERVIEGIGAAT